MTIQELAEESRLMVSNIRYYEQEGLLNSKDTKQEKRDYSEEDLKTLLRIKNMREINISVVEIKHFIKEGADLSKVTENKQKGPFLVNIPLLTIWEMDVIKEEIHPWVRFLARAMDNAIYSIIFSAFYHVCLNQYPARENIYTLISIFVGTILMFLIEPILISRFGTTVGKSIFGIWITNEEDCKLSYKDARQRTFEVLRDGIGFNIPLYNLYRMFKNYKIYEEKSKVSWDYRLIYSFKDSKIIRRIAFVACYIGIYGLNILIIRAAELPDNRGNLTIAEFAENYNDTLEYLGFSTYQYLNEAGEWEVTTENGVVLITGDELRPNYQYNEVDGTLVGVSFEADITTQKIFLGYTSDMIVATMAYVGAQKDISIWNQKLKHMLAYIASHPNDSYSLTEAGVTVSCDITYEGYYASSDNLTLIRNNEGQDGYIHIKFSMSKNES